MGFTHSIYLVPYRIYLKNKSERHRHYHLNIKETSASEKFWRSQQTTGMQMTRKEQILSHNTKNNYFVDTLTSEPPNCASCTVVKNNFLGS